MANILESTNIVGEMAASLGGYISTHKLEVILLIAGFYLAWFVIKERKHAVEYIENYRR